MFFEECKSDIAKTWKGIKSLVSFKPKSNHYPSSVFHNGQSILEPRIIAKTFNDYFVNVGHNLSSKIPQTSKSYQSFLRNKAVNSFYLNPTNPKEIVNIINGLKNGKALGPYSIPIDILKYNADDISTPLSAIINMSFFQGVFPDRCKIAKVLPLYKKENVQLCSNYRPISLLSVFSKIFEKCMYKRLYKFLEKFNILYKNQFGFRSKHSTSHALISLIEYIKKELDSGKLVCGIFIDLQKAFDTVDHEILLSKLDYYGIRDICKDWFASYLKNRHQFVSLGNYQSDLKLIKCGVPQGSNLGPLLFLIYINDITSIFEQCNVWLFADDTHLNFSSKKISTIETVMNYELKHFVTWLKANKLSLNEEKTQMVLFQSLNTPPGNITIKINKYKLNCSDFFKYLGVMIDKNLSWNYHIEHLCQKLSQAIGILSRVRNYVPIESRISIYYSIFFSYLTYGCLVWQFTTQSNISKLVLLQKRCIRVMTFSPFLEHTSNLFKELKLLTVEDIFKENILVFFYKIDKGSPPLSIIEMFDNLSFTHKYETRSVKFSFRLPKVNTYKYGLSSLRSKGANYWNNFVTISNSKEFTSLKQLRKYHKNLCLNEYM